MTATTDPLLSQAVRLVQRWQVCSRTNFQRHMRVGFAKRDALLHQLEDHGYIVFASRDRERFTVAELCWHDACGKPRGHRGRHAEAFTWSES